MPNPQSFNADDSQHLVSRLLHSYHVLLEQPLIEMSGMNPAASLFEFPLPVVAHNTAEDPLFVFANRAALSWFEMRWGDFINMPSRYSAEPDNRAKRQAMLARVSKHGYIDDYSGVRISASGKRFAISHSVIWNVVDEQGSNVGQAACLRQLEYI